MIVNNPNNVAQQFVDDDTLSFRMRFYEKYDSSPIDYSSWLFDKYKFFPSCSILELGCGNGRHWSSRLGKLPKETSLTLSDLSLGMLAEIRKYFPYIQTEQIDAQSIPYSDNTFDFVIANHMLFHIPDLEGALSEIHRVLKNSGTLYAATDSNGGMRGFFRNIVKEYDPESTAFSEMLSFSVENGEEILGQYFEKVSKYEYSWPLKATDSNEIVRWLESTESISGYSSEHKMELQEKFEQEIKSNGCVIIPKICALFVASKEYV